MIEQVKVKAVIFIYGHSLINVTNDEYDLLKHPASAGLKRVLALLLILAIEQLFLTISAALKPFLIPAESRILR